MTISFSNFDVAAVDTMDLVGFALTPSNEGTNT